MLTSISGTYENGVVSLDERPTLTAPAKVIVTFLGEPVAPAARPTLSKPEVAEQLTAQGFEVTSQGPAQFAQLIQAEAQRWPALVRRTGAQPD